MVYLPRTEGVSTTQTKAHLRLTESSNIEFHGMSGILQILLQLPHRLSPKWNHAVLWGWPDGEDSVIALEQALQETRVRTVVLLMSDPAAPLSWQPGRKTRRVKKNSLAGVMWFCLARYVFFTHPCFTRKFPADVMSVNVWHGMPIKKIGWLMENDPGISSRHALATSPFWAEIMAAGDDAPRRRAADRAAAQRPAVFRSRRGYWKNSACPADRRLLVWLPTYRKSVRGLPRTDGVEPGNVFEMPDVDPDELNSFLKSRNARVSW